MMFLIRRQEIFWRSIETRKQISRVFTVFETIDGFDAQGFFSDWIFGTKGLRSGVSIDEIVKRILIKFLSD